MIKVGTEFVCTSELFGLTRDEKCVTIYKHDVIVKVKNNFSDLVHLRDMYMIKESGILVDIPSYTIANKFKEI